MEPCKVMTNNNQCCNTHTLKSYHKSESLLPLPGSVPLHPLYPLLLEKAINDDVKESYLSQQLLMLIEQHHQLH